MSTRHRQAAAEMASRDRKGAGIQTIAREKVPAHGQKHMSKTLAYFLTRTTYGSWLHGDRRGSVDRRNASPGMEYYPPNPAWERAERRRMKYPVVRLSAEQRRIVETSIKKHCRHRGWQLIALNCRSNHVHLILQTDRTSPERAMTELKAYATRALRKAGLASEGRIWTRGASTRHLNSQASLKTAKQYVQCQ